MNSQSICAIAERFPWASWDEVFSDGECIEQRLVREQRPSQRLPFRYFDAVGSHVL